MDRPHRCPSHLSKEECRKRINISAALYVLASNNPFGVIHYSEKYIAGARQIVEKAKKEGYFEVGGNDNGRRD